MQDEILHAADFLARILRNGKGVSKVAVDKFEKCFADRLTKKYRRHWHPLKPQRGSAYRSVIIDHNCVDPLITAALQDASLDSEDLTPIMAALPRELTLWVDPCDVSYRFGDYGSIAVLYARSSSEATSDYESGSSSPESSPTISPSSSPPRSQHEWQQVSPMSFLPCSHEAFSVFSRQNGYINHYPRAMATPVA